MEAVYADNVDQDHYRFNLKGNERITVLYCLMAAVTG